MLLFLISLLALPNNLFAFEAHWQDGRIVDIQPENNGKVLYWIANTPVTKNNEVTYRISVHVKDEIYTANYAPGKTQTAPPKAWVRNSPVKVQIATTSMLLQTPTGETLKASGLRWKATSQMRPIKAEEWSGQLAKTETAGAQGESLVGFSKSAPETSAAASAKPGDAAANSASQAAEETPATLSVSSTPYLADVYIDGKLEGYTPAKLSVVAGKHTVRLEKQGYKSWATDVTVAGGAESTIDARLDVGKR